MKLQVDDDTELANSVKLSDSEREMLGSIEDGASKVDKINSDQEQKDTKEKSEESKPASKPIEQKKPEQKNDKKAEATPSPPKLLTPAEILAKSTAKKPEAPKPQVAAVTESKKDLDEKS